MEIDARTSRGRRNPGPASPRDGGAPRPLREDARRAPLVGLVRGLPERASERQQSGGGSRRPRPLHGAGPSCSPPMRTVHPAGPIPLRRRLVPVQQKECSMSHHFDTPTAREDPRICVNDFYLFDGAAGTTVMAMTVNADAGLSAPDTFRDEGLYAFRFDVNGDAREELTFKFRFGDPRHADETEHRHVQAFQVRMESGADALHGLGGELLVEGETGEFVGRSGIRAYAGLAPDLFAIDAEALHVFMTSFYKEQKYNPQAFVNRKNFFANRNVSAVVLEVPNRLIGEGTVRAWATASLVGHAPEVQVSRWGLPMITHIFLSDHSSALKEAFNRSLPGDDVAQFSEPIAA